MQGMRPILIKTDIFSAEFIRYLATRHHQPHTKVFSLLCLIYVILWILKISVLTLSQQTNSVSVKLSPLEFQLPESERKYRATATGG